MVDGVARFTALDHVFAVEKSRSWSQNRWFQAALPQAKQRATMAKGQQTERSLTAGAQWYYFCFSFLSWHVWWLPWWWYNDMININKSAPLPTSWILLRPNLPAAVHCLRCPVSLFLFRLFVIAFWRIAVHFLGSAKPWGSGEMGWACGAPFDNP